MSVTLNYKKQVDDPPKGKHNIVSYQLHDYVVRKTSQLIENKPITKFLNFGVSYAHLDSILASSYPDTAFIEIDRSVFTKVVNEAEFDKLPNMKFINSDIFNFLQSNKYTGGIFFHTRTLSLLPQLFVEQLYEAVGKTGFEYVF